MNKKFVVLGLVVGVSLLPSFVCAKNFDDDLEQIAKIIAIDAAKNPCNDSKESDHVMLTFREEMKKSDVLSGNDHQIFISNLGFCLYANSIHFTAFKVDDAGIGGKAVTLFLCGDFDSMVSFISECQSVKESIEIEKIEINPLNKKNTKAILTYNVEKVFGEKL